MLRAAILLCGLALLAGCGDDGDEPGAAAGSGGGGTSAARLAGPITFEVIGGEAFRDDRMTVEADGSATVETRAGKAAPTLTAEELAGLAAQVEETNLAEAESALTEPPQPDALSYRFTYGGKQVETDDGAMPDDLAPLIGTFIELVDRYGPS